MPIQSAKTIQIFLPHGDARRLRTAEITTGIVRAIEFPKSELAEFLGGNESNQVGFYFLFGQYIDDYPKLYIGHTGDFRERLRLHEKEKEFWDRAVVFVTQTNSLTQTHTAYLEWRSINEAKTAGRYSLVNANAGSKPFTPAPLEADCNSIFDTARTLLSTLGHPVFEPLISKQPVSADADQQQQIFYCKGPEADGRGVFTPDGFVVLAGSSGRRESVPSIRGTGDDEYRQRLIENQVVRIDGERILFTKDQLISSPSKAAMVLLGRTANGWIEWKAADGRTADEIRRKPAEPIR
jgi:hypothetical protein